MSTPGTSEASGQSKLRRVVERVFALIGLAAAVIGIAIGVPDVIDRFKRYNASDDLAKGWVEQGLERTITPGTKIGSTIVARRLSFQDGTFVVEPGAVIVADTIEMTAGTTLRGTEVVLLARQLRGGRLDFSGSSGSAPGAVGGGGGRVTIATIQASNVVVDVSGGTGTRGAPGTKGVRGREGNCDGFGRYRGADPGGNGGPGGVGGAGGNGGTATYLSAVPGSIQTKALAGTPGLGGVGGAGGQGGRGCVGLGGSQTNQPDGLSGPLGPDGQRAAEGTVTCHLVAASELRRVAGLATTAPDELRNELTRLAKAGGRGCI